MQGNSSAVLTIGLLFSPGLVITLGLGTAAGTVGPMIVAASAVFVPGAVAARVFSPGAVAAEVTS